ncbi:hypothetical protein DSM100688_1315 [Bifidobacterium ramosum]|uniref:Uncharacterized protein n=2 Tax=Bifidobacterium ramosum TaxID=1798158 RepID=A0A6L4X102_9BIFI|nr:hypothetical protein DSM100688_1315 [Bifidobacterium ramosum]
MSLRLHGIMNTATFPTSSSPFATPSSPFDVASPTSYFGAPVYPSPYSCACHAMTAASRDLVAVQSRAVRTVVDRTAAAHIRSATISWDGNAAVLFRQRLVRCVDAARQLENDVAATERLTWIGGA